MNKRIVSCGAVLPKLAGRSTPFHKAHSTEIAGMNNIPLGDDRYYNNVFRGGEGELFRLGCLIFSAGHSFRERHSPA
jgi:hypothetical protein